MQKVLQSMRFSRKLRLRDCVFQGGCKERAKCVVFLNNSVKATPLDSRMKKEDLKIL